MTKHSIVASPLGALVIAGAVLVSSFSSASDGLPGAAAPQQAVASRSVTIDVAGMDCAACTAAIRIALKKLNGVKEAKVSFDEKRATVEYEPARVTPQQLVDAVNKLGYRASLPPGQPGI